MPKPKKVYKKGIYKTKIGLDVIDDITDFPEKYNTGELLGAIHDAWALYCSGEIKATKSWYKQVLSICNKELERRGEKPEREFT